MARSMVELKSGTINYFNLIIYFHVMRWVFIKFVHSLSRYEFSIVWKALRAAEWIESCVSFQMCVCVPVINVSHEAIMCSNIWVLSVNFGCIFIKTSQTNNKSYLTISMALIF